VAAPTLKSALNYYLQRPRLSEADRVHLRRWLKEVRDPVWEQIAADAGRYGALPTFVEGPYSYLISSAVSARHFAESQTDTPAVQRKRKQQREEQDCSDLVALAHKMEEVVRHYEACRKAHLLRRVPSPSGPLPDLPRVAEAKQSLKWLGREAHRLRQLAEKVSAGEPERDWERIPVRVSRQSGGKGKRAQSRELGVFMQEMVDCMHQFCGKPRYDAVATITNIAFPDADVVAEHVRSACRTARGRKRCTQSMK
jgi:hypothetical protein